MSKTERWVETDEAEDIAASVRHALRTLDFANDDPQAWKWVALAIHSAVQGACVCHLVTTATPIGVVTKNNTKDWMSYFEKSRVDRSILPPRTHLLALPDLLKAARKPNSAGDRSNSTGIFITDSELNWLIRFHNQVRSQFVHFEPMTWSIEISGIPEIAFLTARIIKDILDVGYAFRHKDQQWRSAFESDLNQLSSIQ